MMAATRSEAARRFLDAIRVNWDNADQWEDTVRAGELSETDYEDLREICDETDEDVLNAEQEIMAGIIEQGEWCVVYVGAPYGESERGEVVSRHGSEDEADHARESLRSNPKYYGKNSRVEWRKGFGG